ncbi:1069_t:CDS:2 [Ambispora gerdemannii]|uniref:1069_t:CDS:1 n=1 Tax=Ambispora gerdemannii TaxID=144530 RepID=A0A9N8V813_9GLOM|nr:1069_t:CDS:2 [Ambispora gerdemannii]
MPSRENPREPSRKPYTKRISIPPDKKIDKELINIGYYDDDDLRIIPANYTRKRLDELGLFYFNKTIWANCKILVTGIADTTKEQEFPGHELYLVSKSDYFRKAFEKFHQRRPDNNLEIIEDENGSHLRIRVKILVPEFSKFDKMLEWIYTGDSDKWLCSAFTPFNYKIIMENAHYLGLGNAAMAVCIQYREHLTIYRMRLVRQLQEELKLTNRKSISME